MSNYKFNVNNFSIEKDERFFAYVNIIGAERIVKTLNEQEETILKQKRKIKELEKENGRMKGAFKRKFDYDIEDVVDEICDEDW